MLNAHDGGLTEITYAGNINYWIFSTCSINKSFSQLSFTNKQKEIPNLHGMQVTLG